MDGDGDVDNGSDADDEGEGLNDGNDGGTDDITGNDHHVAFDDIAIILMTKCSLYASGCGFVFFHQLPGSEMAGKRAYLVH